jgi:antitoxin HicB
MHTYTVHLTPEPEGGFTVTVPALPGCVTWGADFEQALVMARECIEGLLEALAKAGEPIPFEAPPRGEVTVAVSVALPAAV